MVGKRSAPRRRTGRAKASSPARASKGTALASDAATPERRRPRVIVYVLSFLLLVTAALLGGQWILQRSYFRVQHVVVVGNVHESTLQIERATGLALHPTMLSVSTSSLVREIEAFPWVQRARVAKHWPNTVTVSIDETTAVGVAAKGAGWDYVGRNGADLGVAPATANFPTLVDQKPSARWPFTSSALNAVTVADALPATLSPQVRQVVVSPSGAVSLIFTTPVQFDLGQPTKLTAKFVAVASVIRSATLVPGDVVDVSVPTEVAVTPPGTTG